MSTSPPARGGFLVVPTAALDKALKLAALADPDLNPEPNERACAARLLHAVLKEMMIAPIRQGPSAARTSPPSPEPDDTPPDTHGPIVRLWEAHLGRTMSPPSLDRIKEWSRAFGAWSVLSETIRVIDRGGDPDASWRCFTNVCSKRARESA